MQTLELKIDGMTCGGCANRLMRSVEEKFPGIGFSADHATASGLIALEEGASPAKYLNYLNKLGYKSHLANEYSDKIQKNKLLKIAISFFCFANIMFFALAEYLSPPGDLPVEFIQFFRSSSAILCFVSLFYCASDMNMKALHGIRNLKPNVDLSVSFALTVTYIYSVYTLFLINGSEPYFDSVSATIFFILSGRYLQQRFLFKTQNEIKNKETHQFEMVRKKTESGEEIVGILQVEKGDILLIRSGDVFPVDCILLADHAEISTDLITGEIIPKQVSKGTVIKAGSVSIGKEIPCKTIADGSSSILRDMKIKSLQMSFAKSELVNTSDKMASIFFLIVLVTAASCFSTFFTTDLEMAIERTVAILLLACPCAFAVAIPLASLRCASEAAADNVLFRNVSSIQKLAKCRKFFFDKTGTLSKNNIVVTHAVWNHNLEQKISPILKRVVEQSNHPVSQALANHLSEFVSDDSFYIEIKEIAGSGISFSTHGLTYKLGNRQFCESAPGSLLEADLYLTSSNGKLIAYFELSDQKIENIQRDLDDLKNLGVEVQIVSGDSQRRVDYFAKSIGIDSFVAEASPDYKQMLIDGSKGAAMVGNGFNDLLAISSSSVGISTANSDKATYIASDIHLLSDSISGIPNSIKLARGMMKNLNYAFIFSSVYNLAGMSVAFMGFVNPVVAAILMPINSLVVGSIASRKVE